MSGILWNTWVKFHAFVMEATGHVMSSYVFPFMLIVSHVLSHILSHVLSHVMSQSKSHVKSHSRKSHS